MTFLQRLAAWLNRWSVFVLALALGGLYTIQVHQASERAACQSGYNQAFATQLTERSRLSSRSDQAQSDLLSGVSRAIVAKPTADPKVQAKRREDFLKLFLAFDAAAADVERARAATPLPEIPNC